MSHRWVVIETGEHTKGREMRWCVRCGCLREEYIGPGKTRADLPEFYPVGVRLEGGGLPVFAAPNKAPACKQASRRATR